MTKKRLRKKSANMGKDGSGNKSYWMYGVHACIAAINNPRRQILQILATKNVADRIKAEVTANERQLRVETTDTRTIEQYLPRDAVHQGVIMQVRPLDSGDIVEYLEEEKPIVVLDQVTDPHNIGAILRSAAAFSAAAVVITRNNAPDENAVMAKSACGAMDIVPLIYVTNLATAIDEIKRGGYWAWGLDGNAKLTLREAKPDAKTALVLGAEGKGLRRLTEERCDMMVKLPISEQMESLNVSNAAAIALYEVSCVSS